MLTEGSTGVVVVGENDQPTGYMTFDVISHLLSESGGAAGAHDRPLLRCSPRRARSSPTSGAGTRASATNGNFCGKWFIDNFADRFLPRVVEHIELTLIALAIGFVIAFAAALIAYRYDAVRAAVRERLGALLHDPQHRALPDHGARSPASAG